MQPFQREQQQQQQSNGRLTRQLPAETSKEKTPPFSFTHQRKFANSAPTRFNPFTRDQQHTHQQLHRAQTDLREFDTHRSLSSCPTYSSLSRHSPETRECATQITTLPVHRSQQRKRTSRSSSQLDHEQLVLLNEIPVEEVELMPISSGFGYYPYNYPTTITQRVPGAGPVSPPTKVPPRRPPVEGKQSPRSDTSNVTNHRNETIGRLARPSDQVANGSRRVRAREPVTVNNPVAVEERRVEPRRTNGTTKSHMKQSESSSDLQDYGRKPLRFTSDDRRSSYHSPAPPTTTIVRDAPNRGRQIHVDDSNYVIERRRRQPVYIYEDYPAETTITKSPSNRVVRVIRDRAPREHQEVYYTEPEPAPARVVYESATPRRKAIVRRSSPGEFVYVDEAAGTPIVRRRERAPRSEVVYVDGEQSTEYIDEYVYVDEDGNEVEVVQERNPSTSQHVEYVYEDERDKRISRPTKVVYVDADGKSQKKSKKASSTRVVYD